MKYNLAIYFNGENYEINDYSKLAGFEHLNEKKLKDIVEFTNEFENEQELISFLIDVGLIPQKFLKGTIYINYYKNKDSQPKRLQYGVSFKKDKKFFDTIFLKYYFREKLTNQDFMEAFIDKYYKYLKDVNIFSEKLNYINYSFDYYKRFKCLPSHAEEYIESFVGIYCRKKSKDGYYKADFTRIRDLAMFSINYERNFNKYLLKTDTTEETKLLLKHYHSLMNSDYLSEEEAEAYNTAINNLENELEINQTITLNRRRKNGTT